ncbi:MAG: DUF2358 domain-containing protein [Verrucomicrobia bacterium]|nr:DUF2358 domain-containing protein [Leptolyngbya sp. ES-bin-22]
MDILQVLKDDYHRFPADQTYSIYAKDVYFKDPTSEFRGVDRYKQTIAFVHTWFRHCRMELHSIEQTGDTIRSEWTLSWNTPLPWQPRITIPGWSELTLNAQGLIASHIDDWRCSRLDVLKQHFLLKTR